MIILNYTPNLTGLTILKTKDEQKSFFWDGHPQFLIPDFYKEKCDIWISFIEYLQRINNKEIFDQDGGEIYENEIINSETGLTKCKYRAYVMIGEQDEYEEICIEIEGYLVKENYFLATKVSIPTSVFLKVSLD